jgi:hypothetical protein
VCATRSSSSSSSAGDSGSGASAGASGSSSWRTVDLGARLSADELEPTAATASASAREREQQRREDDRLARKNHTGKYSSNYAASAVQSELERELGRRNSGGGMSQEELEQRFPQLRNAPVEGQYAANVQVKHKPLGGFIRYVQCKRCGIWGHASGDRECSLRNYNPQDLARQQREDPMALHLSSATVAANALELDKQKLVYARAVASIPGVDSQTLQYIRNKNIALKSGPGAAVGTSGVKRVANFGGGDVNYDLVESDEEDHGQGSGAGVGGHGGGGGGGRGSVGDGVEELSLLAALTPREKRLLVDKLQQAHLAAPDAVSDLLDIILHAESQSAADGVAVNSKGRDGDGENTGKTAAAVCAKRGRHRDRKNSKREHYA